MKGRADMSDILSLFSVLFLPVLIGGILIFGLIKKIPVYDTFIEGAREGLDTCFDILPFIIGIFIAIEALTTSGAMGLIEDFLKPFLELIGIPEDLTSIILLRPVSGSGSLVVVEKIMEKTGTDTLAGRAASVMVGSCETVFYVLALYFSVTSVKKMRHAFAAGLIGYAAGILASVYICYFI